MTFSRSKIAGSVFLVAGVLSLEPVMGQHLLPVRFTEFPGSVLSAIASLFAIATGVSLLFWRTKIAFFGISGKETWIRLFLLAFPVLLLAAAEGVLISLEELNDPVGADDLKARKLMVKNWGKAKYKGIRVVAPVESRVFTVNSDGFRTYEFDTPRRETIRIVLLGGSTGFGWGVADQNGIDKNLESLLGKRTNSSVRVFNLSVPAITFAQENVLFENLVGRISPDVVVFYHGANDGLAWFEQTIGRADTSQSLAPSFFSRATLLHYAYESRLFRMFVEATRPSSPAEAAPDIDVSKAVSSYESHFAASRRLCASTRCLYLIQPIIFNKRPRTPREVKLYRKASALFPSYEQMYEKFTDALIAKSFADHRDGRDIFSGSNKDIFLDYVHVSPAGNRIVARFIADALCDGGYVGCD